MKMNGCNTKCEDCPDEAALAQPEQEPVAHFGSAYVNENGVHITTVLGPVAIPQDAKLYTTPPQRPWVGLTDEEMESIFLHCRGEWNGDYWKIEDANFHPFLRTIEAKLKEKNNG